MKIAVIGSRGIPNSYGGFEQFAENVTALWVEMGHEVICYNPHVHYFNKDLFNGVEIKRIFCPENIIGSSAHFLYDYLSLRDAVRNDCDIFLELGYQSSAPSFLLVGKKTRSRIITNMDGMEWMRSKWSPLVKFITKISERIAVSLSGRLISDNEGIADYIRDKYGMKSDVIAYGCDLVEKNPQKVSLEWLSEDEVYDLVVARLEPENNIHTIIDAFICSGVDKKLIIVGGLSNQYAKGLLSKYDKSQKVIFAGGIYDQHKINSLRQHCMLYFHGHSVGGTNPSLIEAMANGCRIIAHDNVFNRAVLESDSLYFDTSLDLKAIIQNGDKLVLKLDNYRNANLEKIKIHYRWEDIAKQYVESFESVISR